MTFSSLAASFSTDAASHCCHPGWSAFWDKRDGVWRAAEDDPSSELYVEDANASRVIDYMATHTRRDARHDHGA